MGFVLALNTGLVAQDSNTTRPDTVFSAARVDSVVITNEMVWGEVGHDIVDNTLIAGAGILSIPVGVIYGFHLAIYLAQQGFSEPRAAIAAGFITYPALIMGSITNIQKKKAKIRILARYPGKRIVDRTTFSSQYLPSWSIFIGGNYSRFLTSGVTSRPAFSWGVTYLYPINRYFRVGTGLTISDRDIWVRNKRYYDSWSDDQVDVVDIHYQGSEISSPFHFQLMLPLTDESSAYIMGSAGYRSQARKSRVVKVETIDKTADYDYYHSDGWQGFGLIHTVGLGYTHKKTFCELRLVRDLSAPARGLKWGHLLINDELVSYELIIGHELPIK